MLPQLLKGASGKLLTSPQYCNEDRRVLLASDTPPCGLVEAITPAADAWSLSDPGCFNSGQQVNVKLQNLDETWGAYVPSYDKDFTFFDHRNGDNIDDLDFNSGGSGGCHCRYTSYSFEDKDADPRWGDSRFEVTTSLNLTYIDRYRTTVEASVFIKLTALEVSTGAFFFAFLQYLDTLPLDGPTILSTGLTLNEADFQISGWDTFIFTHPTNPVDAVAIQADCRKFFESVQFGG